MKTAAAFSQNHLHLGIRTYLNGTLTTTMALKQRLVSRRAAQLIFQYGIPFMAARLPL
jgi:hypothetical protein